MISLENFMRFRGGDDAETGSGYESESSLAESSAAEFRADAEPPAPVSLKDDSRAHYDANTDLEVEEEVDPRVGAALDALVGRHGGERVLVTNRNYQRLTG